MLSTLIKGSILASFFLLNIQLAHATTSRDSPVSTRYTKALSQIANDPLWHLLLQLKNEKPISNDESVYIGGKVKSPLKEAEQTLALLLTEKAAICQYPARLRLFSKYIPNLHHSIPSADCKDYRAFLSNVPIDRLTLIYASENVTSASSMMGHIMISLAGVNQNDIDVEHGVTFFTELDSLNVPKIMYDTLISGKEGVFKVAPYQEFEAFYLYEEQRNVWRYTLDFTDEQKQLLQDYIWEMGQQSPEYFFHIFNCATVTQLLISIARPDMFDSVADWLTPLDVVKFANKHTLISKTEFLPSNKWKVSMLAKNIEHPRRALISTQLNSPSPSLTDLSFIETKYAQALNQYYRNTEGLSLAKYQFNAQKIRSRLLNFDSLALDISDLPSPVATQNEAYLGMGLSHINGASYARFRAFPVARRLQDDNRSALGESELILADIGFRIGIDQQDAGKIFLDNAMLYQMISRVPITKELHTFSSSFQLGVTRVLTPLFEQKLIAQTEFGLGLTTEPTNGFGMYANFILGAGANKAVQYIYAKPVMGAYFYSRYDNKINMELQRTYNQYSSDKPVDSIELTISQYGIGNISLDLELKAEKLGDDYFRQANVMLAYRF